jgi:hypothetical protein
LLELREAVRDLADIHDQARGILDRVHAVRHIARMRLSPAHGAAKAVHPLVGDDGLHGGGLADHAPGRFDAVLLQIANQAAHPDATHFLVIAQRIVNRVLETAGIQGVREPGGLRKRDGNEALHVRGAARIELAVALDGGEGIRIPALPVDGHYVRVARENEAGYPLLAQSGEQVGLFAAVVVSEAGRRAELDEIVAGPLDQAEIGVARYGLKGDQALEQGARRNAWSGEISGSGHVICLGNKDVSLPECTDLRRAVSAALC